MQTFINEQAIRSVPANAIKNIIKITWLDLKQLRDNSQLIPGMKYRIIDYVTTTIAPGTVSALHPFDVVVTALDESHLSEEASALPREGDTYFDDENLQAWKIWYCLDNDSNRFSWAGEIYSEVEVIRSDLYKEYGAGKALYKGNISHNGKYTPVYVISSDTATSGVGFDDWVGVICNGSSIECEVRNGQPQDSPKQSHVAFEQTNLLSKGVIYRMIDEHNNDCPYDFKNIKYLLNYERKFIDVLTMGELFDLVRGNGVRLNYPYSDIADEAFYSFSNGIPCNCKMDSRGLIMKQLPFCILSSNQFYNVEIKNVHNCILNFHDNLNNTTICCLNNQYLTIEAETINDNCTTTVTQNSSGDVKIYCEADLV